METLFDKVKADYILLSLMTNIVGIGATAISNIFANINDTCARVICMAVFSTILANIIHLSIACLTRLASIFLVGMIEDVKGKIQVIVKL
jgi:hypothetical protein